jgi:hypothetical protein
MRTFSQNLIVIYANTNLPVHFEFTIYISMILLADGWLCVTAFRINVYFEG